MSPDVHTATGAYVVHALPTEERETFEGHLAECPSCAQEVRELLATAARLGAAAATATPASMRARVLARIAVVRQLPPIRQAPPASAPSGPPRAARWLRPLLAVAAALALVAGLGLGALAISADRRADEASALARQLAAMASDPGRMTGRAALAGGGQATVVAAGGRAAFLAEKLAPPGPDRSYQLWLIGPSGIRSGGLLEVGRDGRAEQLLDGLGDAQKVGLSVEPAGGSPAPTTKPVVVVTLA